MAKLKNSELLEDYRSLLEDVDQWKTELAKIEGAQQSLLKQLEEKFDCDSLEAAEKLLVKLEQQQVAQEKKFAKMLKEFKDEWQHLFGEMPRADGTMGD